ncbi:MAG TPA: hypothetical protein VF322_08290 [Gammaproteobacteria bacterium]
MQERPERELTFKDYIAVFKRRGGLFFAIAAPIITIGVLLAFGLPPIYESTGVLLVEQSEVPEHLVRSAVPDYPGERVRAITERVLTEENLAEIVERYGLYPERAADPESQVRELRRSIAITAEDPASLRNLIGNPENPIAFRVTFRHGDPQTAQRVADDLIKLYLSENFRARRELAQGTSAFLAEQARMLEQEIAKREAELARFKSKHAGTLPELSNMNMQLLDRTERDLQDVESEIRTLRERVSLYESELAQLSPYTTVLDDQGNPILSPRDRLKMLQRTYVQLSAIYTQDHPDVQKTKREIDALSAQTGLPGIDRSILQTELNARLDELAAAQERYSDDHPDVVRLQRTVDNLRQALAEAPRAAPRAAAAAAPPDNPVYIQRQVQLEGTRVELQAALQRREELRRRLQELEQRLTMTPEVEREYSSLTRGLDELHAQYADIQRKQREAEIAVNLESESKGERFTVLSSPGVPSLPSDPNRIAILLLTFALAMGGGAGGVSIAEISDGTVRSARDVQELLEIPPLVMIPHIDNEKDIRNRRWKRLAVATVVCAWIGVTAYMIMNPVG